MYEPNVPSCLHCKQLVEFCTCGSAVKPTPYQPILGQIIPIQPPDNEQRLATLEFEVIRLKNIIEVLLKERIKDLQDLEIRLSRRIENIRINRPLGGDEL